MWSLSPHVSISFPASPALLPSLCAFILFLFDTVVFSFLYSALTFSRYFIFFISLSLLSAFKLSHDVFLPLFFSSCSLIYAALSQSFGMSSVCFISAPVLFRVKLQTVYQAASFTVSHAVDVWKQWFSIFLLLTSKNMLDWMPAKPVEHYWDCTNVQLTHIVVHRCFRLPSSTLVFCPAAFLILLLT